MNTDTCRCCELPPSTPLVVSNRPGLQAVVFRAGTYSSFRLSMLQRIASMPALSALHTRSDDDYAVTLLDMWATIADILTFYQERVANEGYLRTARLRDSILRMARLLDYHLKPGVAATTLLAFTLDKNTSLQIPVGLRVQSVPADDEQPQVYETLESILADAMLNRNRIVPAPEGFNPLAKGSTSGILAPGPEGLAAAAALSPGGRFVLFQPTTGLIEDLVVREVRVNEGNMILTWSGSIQGANWSFDSPAYSVNRTFRIFGYNAPSTYMEAVETAPNSGDFFWTRRTFTDASYAYSPPSTNLLELQLDTKYEGIAVGTRLLISQPASASGPGSNDLVTVTAVSQGQVIFKAPSAGTSPVQDTVTLLTFSFVPPITDRRNTLIYEITSPRIKFWGYRYPGKLSGPTVHVPALRIDPETVEIGRTIEKNAFKAGARLSLKTIEVGRQVILQEPSGMPTAAEVTGMASIGLDVSIATTPDDLTTAIELRLNPEEAQRLTGLRSSPLSAPIVLTSSERELEVTIGQLPPRTIKLSSNPSNVSAVAIALQAGLNASLPVAPEFSQCRVTHAENTLIILTGVSGSFITFGPTTADETTAGELGLISPGAIRIDALISGDLSAFPAVANPLRELSVAFGPIGPRTVALSAAPSNLVTARSLLQAVLAGADPSPAFQRVAVIVVGSRLLIVPGTGGSSIQEYLAITLQPELPFELSSSSAVLLGNIALSSHGETVADEVLGDGDASAAFQKFELQKKPLTYIPSSGPGGIESTLEILVNDVRWTEVPSLFGRSSVDQVYRARLADDGTVAVQFGDGRSGARLLSGRGNIVANYREGVGLNGKVGTLQQFDSISIIN